MMVRAFDDFLPLIVTAPSGGGKTTLVGRLLGAFPDLVQSVSYTTRAPRPGEETGRDYHFVDAAEFDAMVAGDAFAEWAEVHGHRYGTAFARVEAARLGHRGVVFVIDVQGARQIKARIPDAVGVFVLPPSLAELERRLRGRGTDPEPVIVRRMHNALGEMQHYGLFDYLVLNDALESATEELVGIVRAERARRGARARAAETVLRGGEARRG